MKEHYVSLKKGWNKVAVCVFFLLLISNVVFAATYVVTETDDDGASGTLRWAISQSNASGSIDDVINFNLTTGSTVTITSELPQITDAVTINGNDTGTGLDVTVTVENQTTSTHKVFSINATGETIDINHMILRGGDCSGYYGGSVQIVNGTLNLSSVTIEGSKASYGGGIYVSSGSYVSLDECVIQNCSASNYGGGICSGGTISLINNSKIDNNTCASQGGGIAINSNGAITTLSNSTVSNNSADSYGGGIYTGYPSTIGTMVNCTVSSNSATLGIGGIYANGCDITLMESCTIANNHDPGSWGSGFYLYGSVTIKNTILANNDDGYDFYFNGGAIVTDNGYNIVENSYNPANTTGGFANINSILYNTKYNDGTTSNTTWTQGGTEFAKQTLYLSSTLALNNNPNGTYTLTYTNGSSIGIDDGTGTDPDQRGATVYNGIKDIGAYEWWGSPGTLPVTLSTFTADFINNTLTLYWETQSEVDNLGWNIYRNDEELFSTSELLTEEMIPGNGTTTEPSYYNFEDDSQLEIAQTYYYWLESIDYSGISQVYSKVAQITIPDPSTNPPQIEPPIVYDCKNAPNPVNGSTSFSFTLDKSSMVSVSIYNIKGALIRTLPTVMTQPDETSQIYWNGKDSKGNDLSPGVYFYNLIVDGKTQETKKLILMK